MIIQRLGYILLLVFISIASVCCSKQKDEAVTEFGKEHFPVKPVTKADVKFMEAEQSEIRATLPSGVKAERFFITYDEDKMVSGLIFTSDTSNGKALLFLHWLGGITNVDRGVLEFHGEAAEYAAKGYVCAVPEGYFPWASAPQGVDEDITSFKRQITDYRQVLYMLTKTLNNSDASVGIVGHDYGGMHAFALAASDKRISFICSMTPTSDYWSWNTIVSNFKSGGDFENNYREAFKPFEPVNLISEMKIPVLIQFADIDTFVSEDVRNSFTEAKTSEVIVKMYESDHDLNNVKQATEDRQKWVLSM